MLMAELVTVALTVVVAELVRRTVKVLVSEVVLEQPVLLSVEIFVLPFHLLIFLSFEQPVS